MDGQSREDIERRLIECDAAVERCLCDKTGKKKTVIRGYAALFQSDSQDLGGFVERIMPGAFDNVIKRGTDVVALYNHEPMFLLGRESAGTLRLSVDERGLRYEIDAPDSRADVVEAIERGDVRGSSFAFKVKGQGEKWTKMQDGRQLREIVDFDGLFDVGPVLRPAYPATETFVSRRALEMARKTFSVGDFVAWDGGVGRIEYVMTEGMLGSEGSEYSIEATPEQPAALVRVWESDEGIWEETDTFVGKKMSDLVTASGILGEVVAMMDERAVNLKPTAGMAAAAKRGLRLHEEGKSGDGLKPETVARANRLARREEMNPDWVREMNAWFARHESDRKPGWDKAGSETPGFVAHLLWGGTPAKNFSARKVKQMEADDRSAATAAEEQRAEADMESLSPANFALYEAIEQISVENGQWPQEGPDGAHYMSENPFAAKGMRCENCIFWEEGGACEVVEGKIDPGAICKLWVIPEERLVVKAERCVNPASEAARLKAKSLETAAHGRSR